MAERRLARCGEYPSVLCSTTGLPTLIDSSAPAYPIQPLPDRPEEGRPVPGREGPAAGELRRRGDRRAPSTWEAVRLREADWYPTRNVGASEAIQISANRAECVCQWIDYIRYEKLPASSPKERDVGDADRESSVSAAARQLKTPLPTVSRKVFELESHLRTKLFNRSSRKDQQPKQRSSEIADMINYSPSWRVGRHFTLSSRPTLFADHAAPCRKPFSRMLIHPVGELRCAH